MAAGNSVVSELILALGACAIGVWIGALFTLAHRSLPLLIVGLIVVGCLLAGLRLVASRRILAIGGAVGVLAAIGLLGVRGVGGGLVIQDDASGWAWQIGCVAIAAIALAWPRLTGRAGDTMEP